MENLKKLDEILGEFSYILHNLNYKNIENKEEFVKKLVVIWKNFSPKIFSILESYSDYYEKFLEFKEKLNLAIPNDFPFIMLFIFSLDKKEKGVYCAFVSRTGQFENTKNNVFITFIKSFSELNQNLDFRFIKITDIKTLD